MNWTRSKELPSPARRPSVLTVSVLARPAPPSSSTVSASAPAATMTCDAGTPCRSASAATSIARATLGIAVQRCGAPLRSPRAPHGNGPLRPSLSPRDATPARVAGDRVAGRNLLERRPDEPGAVAHVATGSGAGSGIGVGSAGNGGPARTGSQSPQSSPPPRRRRHQNEDRRPRSRPSTSSQRSRCRLRAARGERQALARDEPCRRPPCHACGSAA